MLVYIKSVLIKVLGIMNAILMSIVWCLLGNTTWKCECWDLNSSSIKPGSRIKLNPRTLLTLTMTPWLSLCT